MSSKVLLNIDFTRTDLKSNIYDQTILEGIVTTYHDTETIIDNGKVKGMRATEIQKF